MATVPKARTTLSDVAGAVASGTDTICVIAPVATSPDIMPRQYGNASAILAQHGYADGVEYADYHATKTGKPIIFIGLPIATPGVVSRVDVSGNTGSSVVSVTAGAPGVLGYHEGLVVVDRGGIVGTDQIRLFVSLDGGRNSKSVKLGTGTSYVVPFVGVTIAFGAGTLVANDVVIQWVGSSPRSDASGWAAARAVLGSQLRFFRSLMLIGDLQTHTEAQALLDQIAAYRSVNERFIYARAAIKDRNPAGAFLSKIVARMTGAPALTFANVGSADTATRAAGSWLTDGFQPGDVVTFAGSASNNVTGPIVSLTATVITFGAVTSLTNEGPVSNVTAVGSPGVVFAATTITRNRGSWTDDGFRASDLITIAGSVSNNITGLAISAATTLVLTTTGRTAETVASSALTVTAGQTKAAWMAAAELEYETVTGGADGFRIDLSAGRGRYTSGLSGWAFRRPAAWFASAREYQHDLHIPVWAKQDGPVGADLYDDDGALVEWDDRDSVDGGAASAARFTSLRTWGNGPAGAFITQSLTRGDEGSLTSFTHNVAVINHAMTVCQLNTEYIVGRVLTLNQDGTGTTDALSTIQKFVNDALERELLVNKFGEGPRLSSAVWTPSPTDNLNVPAAAMTGVLKLLLNGTIHDVITTVRI